MSKDYTQLAQLLHEQFKNAEDIAELRERLRDVEEELHAVFANELSRFVSNDNSKSGTDPS